MCRHVKSIEIIEFGYEKSDDGVNGAKSEYCVDKQKINMTRPYQAALKEATGSRAAVDGLRALYDLWMKALASLKWKRGEDDDAYKARIAKPLRRLPRAGECRAHRARRAARPRADQAKPRARCRKRQALIDDVRDRRGQRRRLRIPCRAGHRARRDLRRGRHARARAPRLPLSPAAARDGRGRRAGDPRRGHADRRSRHRHRQDLRLPRPGAALRRQGHRLDRHQDAAGPALPARPAAGARRARRCRSRSRCSRAAPTTSAITISSAPPPRGGCRRATTRAISRRSSRSRTPPKPATAASSPTFRRTRRSGRWSPRPATTASAQSARITPSASC